MPKHRAIYAAKFFWVFATSCGCDIKDVDFRGVGSTTSYEYLRAVPPYTAKWTASKTTKLYWLAAAHANISTPVAPATAASLLRHPIQSGESEFFAMTT